MSSNRTNDDELEMNLLNIDTNTYDHIDSTQIQTPRTGDRISIEISTLLSPNSQPEIMFIEELLCFIAKSSKSTCAGDDGRGDSTAADAAADGHTISNESRIRKSKTWIEELEEKLKSRRDNLKATSFAHKLNKMSFQTIAFNRLPAILSTITLEMGVTVVISSFSTLIQKHMLIAAFFPVLSAIAGNIGLQSSTATLRALATGHASTSIASLTTVVKREVQASAIIGLVAGIVLFLVSSLWSSNIYFGLVTGTAILLNSIFSGILGSIGPMAFKLYGVDPALMAGPFETALQDVIGTLIYLILASLLL